MSRVDQVLGDKDLGATNFDGLVRVTSLRVSETEGEADVVK